ncbi:MAG: molybdopterin molybdotransferase MoeA [Actinobacteria bacterium]|nr:molybdopterin molybdotransferase MoeA [Actinomycetota bacterium]
MRDLLTVEEYLAELLLLVRPDDRCESVPLAAATGRVLAAEVASTASIPAFDNSAMDGYAVRFADVVDAPVTLSVVGDVPAGSPLDPAAGPGECVRIMTGAPLPTFADTVVPVEHTEVQPGAVVVRVAPARIGQHVRRAGEDIASGAVVAGPGAVLTPARLGALAAAGIVAVPVRPRPVVAVCATGDELVTDGSTLRRGQIHESNSVALAAALERDGADARRSLPVGDAPDALAARLDDLVTQGCDLAVLTGGASVGAYDVVRDVLTGAGGTFRHVRVQPGKPQGWAVWQGLPVVSLPGNPLSASLSYEVFVRPLLDHILGRPGVAWFGAVAGSAWTSPAGRRQLLPVRLGTDGDGRLVAVPSHVRGSASHVVTSLADADGIAAVAEDVDAVAPGDLIQVRWL